MDSHMLGQLHTTAALPAARALRPGLLRSAQDCFNRPICSAPDAWIDIVERTPVNGQK